MRVPASDVPHIPAAQGRSPGGLTTVRVPAAALPCVRCTRPAQVAGVSDEHLAMIKADRRAAGWDKEGTGWQRRSMRRRARAPGRGTHALPGATRWLSRRVMFVPLVMTAGVSWKLPVTLSSEQIAPLEALLFLL